MKKKTIKKSFTTYFSKLRKLPSHVHLSSPRLPAAVATSRLLSSCKYPKTLSFHSTTNTGHRTSHSAKLADIEAYMHEHFQSLYINDSGENLSNHPPVELVHSSDLFFGSPSTSNSLAEEEPAFALASSSSGPSNVIDKVLDSGVSVTMYSKDPYENFRRSMQEMVDAGPEGIRHELDWDFMEDLLNWHMKSNERSVHKHILRAFVDVTVSFGRSEMEEEGRNTVVGKSVRRRRVNIEDEEAE